MKIVVDTRLPLPTDSWLEYSCPVSMHLISFAFTETTEKFCGGRDLYLCYIITDYYLHQTLHCIILPLVFCASSI